jgi:glycerol-3-phosphate dehydrogenase subunit C
MHTTSLLSVGNTLDECIKCNICTSYCPFSEVTDLFPGPKYVGPQAERFREVGQPHSPDHSVDYCSGCRVCNEVCPTGVRIAEINARARAQIVADHGLSWRNWLLGRNEWVGKAGSFVPALANFALHNPVSRILAEQVMGIAREAPLPRWPAETLNSWLARTAQQRLKSDQKVVYFHGCAIQYYEPYVAKAAIAVLEHNGYQVIVPPQNCCGLPMLSNGDFETGDAYHRGNVARLSGFARAGYPILSSSPSCSLTLKEEAAEMLDKHDEATLALKNATWDIFEWLRELADKGKLRTDFKPLTPDGSPLVIPYHAPCQYRAHRVGKPPMDVLSLIPGLDLRESLARCCGIAGTYGYKVEKHQIAMDVGKDLFDFVLAQGDVPYVACDTETCRWQIEQGTGVPNRHPIELLAAAYGLYDLARRDLANDRSSS